MDYKMQITLLIDTVEKKNVFRDALLADIVAQELAENIKSYSMLINGIIVQEEDSETYSSED